MMWKPLGSPARSHDHGYRLPSVGDKALRERAFGQAEIMEFGGANHGFSRGVYGRLSLREPILLSWILGSPS